VVRTGLRQCYLGHGWVAVGVAAVDLVEVVLVVADSVDLAADQAAVVVPVAVGS